MLVLNFEVDGQRYGVDTEAVLTVMPAVRLRRIPGAAAELAGLLNFRGEMIPVIDVTQVLAGRPASEHFSTRLVIFSVPAPSGRMRLIGLLLEKATGGQIAGVPGAAKADDPGINLGHLPHLGSMLIDADDSLQLLRPAELMPADVWERLLTDAAATAADGQPPA